MQAVTQTDIKACPLVSRGKVRDIYALSPESLLIVTTDRISAYDVIMPDPIPQKGVILNQITLFWMDRFKDLIPNHLLATDVTAFPAELAPYADMLAGRAVVVKKAKPLPIECIVRGYIPGSGLKDYQATGTVGGHPLPAGLIESQILPEPIFTPSTKADLGAHDENITVAKARDLLEPSCATRSRPRVWPCTPRPGISPGRRHPHRRHQVRVRPDRRRTHPHRRGPDSGFLAFLASRRL
jgi:phosphoribosylaminoimidazole-succinocarboxamide synthase